MSVCISPLVQATTLMTDECLSCSQCPKSFSSTKLLQQHQQMFHTDKSVLLSLKTIDVPPEMDRAFICETCGKAFRFRSNLAEHRSVHTALKPYVCKFCGKSSRLKGNLTKHILKHHKKEQNEAIGKDDIIVKKAPKTTKENGSTTNGTTASTSTSTTSVITTSSAGTINNNNNNNSNTVANNNHRVIKMEIEDPDYLGSGKVSPAPVVLPKLTPSTPSTPRSRPQAKENNNITTPAVIVASSEDSCLLPKDLTTDNERSVLISLGFDFGSTLTLKQQLAAAAAAAAAVEGTIDSVSPDTVNSDSDPDFVSNSPPLANNNNTVGNETTMTAMILAATSASRGEGSPDSTDSQKDGTPSRELSPESEPSGSNDSCPSPSKIIHCKECGKLVRKSSHLPIHMTLSHGYPPPPVTVIDETNQDQMISDINVQKELRAITNAINELKAAQANAPKVDEALSFFDTRVGRLERSLETALNSIYTLVQLQTGMASSVNRLREDSQRSFNELKAQLELSITPRRSRRESSQSLSDGKCRSHSRSRSRSPL